MSRPAISVVVPCRNERATLEACLDALLDQDFPRERYEVIVVDGGSTDGSREVAAARGVRLLADGHAGASGARNVGIRQALAPIVAFTDADCVPRRDWLARVAEVFAEHPGVAGVAGAIRMPHRTLLGRMEDMEAQAYYRGVITSNVAYRRDVLVEVGGFDERLDCAEDYDLAWRIEDAGHRVVHDLRPVVVHQPPEVDGSVAGYLAKHFWYARHDVPANMRAVLRAARRGQTAPGSVAAMRGVADAARDAALVVGLAGALASRRPVWAAALAGATAALAARRILGAARQGGGVAATELPAMMGLVAARTMTRGVGTLVGVAGLASPARREVVTAPEVRLAPSAPSPLVAPAPSRRPSR